MRVGPTSARHHRQQRACQSDEAGARKPHAASLTSAWLLLLARCGRRAYAPNTRNPVATGAGQVRKFAACRELSQRSSEYRYWHAEDRPSDASIEIQHSRSGACDRPTARDRACLACVPCRRSARSVCGAPDDERTRPASCAFHQLSRRDAPAGGCWGASTSYVLILNVGGGGRGDPVRGRGDRHAIDALRNAELATVTRFMPAVSDTVLVATARQMVPRVPCLALAEHLPLDLCPLGRELDPEPRRGRRTARRTPCSGEVGATDHRLDLMGGATGRRDAATPVAPLGGGPGVVKTTSPPVADPTELTARAPT
jgi:hypothetical protein